MRALHKTQVRWEIQHSKTFGFYLDWNLSLRYRSKRIYPSFEAVSWMSELLTTLFHIKRRFH